MNNQDIAQAIVEDLKQKSMKYSTDGQPNYAYVTGGLEVIIEGILSHADVGMIEDYKKRVIERAEEA